MGVAVEVLEARRVEFGHRTEVWLRVGMAVVFSQRTVVLLGVGMKVELGQRTVLLGVKVGMEVQYLEELLLRKFAEGEFFDHSWLDAKMVVALTT